MVLKNLRDEIKLLALDLNIADSLRGVCPFCNATHEHSFTITRTEEGLLYNCYRSSCPDEESSGFIGTMPQNILNVASFKKEKTFRSKSFKYPTSELPLDIEDILYTLYGFIPSCKWDTKYFRLVFEARDYNGYTYGHVAKVLPGYTNWPGPKSVNYFETRGSHLYYPPFFSKTLRLEVGDNPYNPPFPVTIVEDCISAQKVNGVALLGTHMTDEQALSLRKHFNRLIIALDPDAAAAAERIVRKYRLYFDNIRILDLDKDPKDTTYEEWNKKYYHPQSTPASPTKP